MEESSDSDSYYVDLPSSLTLSLPKHMHLLTYDELCFGRYNFDSFKMQVTLTLTLGPFGYGLEVQSLSAKMTSVMEEGDEDQMEDETELVRTLHGKDRLGKYHPIFFGRIDHRFPFYFAPNRQGFIKFKIEEPFRRWTIMAKPGKNSWERMKEDAEDEG